ncbi:DUF1523 family protein [Paracoccus pacificus]|uniref:DUF1523 family protein n=1 Tax=Paracoccus pacificus TaxID=1463598 RepID=A0ABW4R905_9RHOB
MRRLKWILMGIFALFLFLFLDYTLPTKTTVRVTNVYNRLTDIGPLVGMFYASADSGTETNAQGQRDIRFIDTARANGKVMVYRNEDTGWIWPPYFKYDSSNLQAEASDAQSTSEAPKWVSVTSYGWRIPMISAYPNAISMRPVAGPDVNPTNWGLIIFTVLILAFLLLFWRMWAQFRERTIDPTLARADAAWNRVEDGADAARDRVVTRATDAKGRFRGWLDSWRGKPRK